MFVVAAIIVGAIMWVSGFISGYFYADVDKYKCKTGKQQNA